MTILPVVEPKYRKLQKKIQVRSFFKIGYFTRFTAPGHFAQFFDLGHFTQ